VLQCVAVCCSVLQCVAVCCSVLQCVTVCCSVLQSCCSALQCVALCCSVLQCVAVVLQCVAVCCIVLQCVEVCCSDAFSKIDHSHSLAHRLQASCILLLMGCRLEWTPTSYVSQLCSQNSLPCIGVSSVYVCSCMYIYSIYAYIYALGVCLVDMYAYMYMYSIYVYIQNAFLVCAL